MMFLNFFNVQIGAGKIAHWLETPTALLEDSS